MTVSTKTPGTAPDYDAIKTKQQATWAAGDYARIGATLQIVGESLAETMDLAPGSRVLDAAAGNGNATLAFARRWCDVTSTDYVESLLKSGRKRADANGLTVDFEVADAENLPYEAEDYDAVVSTFGVMFAPDQKRVAGELLRVCRFGGRIGMANWTPNGFIGEMFKTLGAHIAPPAGVVTPANWGNRDWIESAFGPGATNIDFLPRNFLFRYPSPQFFVDYFRAYYGPVHKAFLALDDHAGRQLESDLLALIGRFNTATDGSMRVPSEYAEIVIDR